MTDVELRQDASAEYVKGWNDGIAARKELDDLSAIDPVALEPRSLGRNEMSDKNTVTVRTGVDFFGVCFFLFYDFNGKYDLYDAIMHWLMK